MAAVTVIGSYLDANSNPNFKTEVVHCTVVNNNDTYTSTDIGTITAATVSSNDAAIAAADAAGVTFAANVATFRLIAGAANKNYTLKLYGTG